MIRKEKEKIVAELKQVFSDSKGLYLTDFTGIDVASINELRREFRQNNITYRVIKNTLARRSVKEINLDELYKYLDGPTGIAYSYDDGLAPGKLIIGFQKKSDLLPIKAALIEGEVYDRKMAERIVALPPRDVLLGSLLRALNSPVTGFVMVLGGLLRNLVGVFDQIREQKEKQGNAPAVEAEAQPSPDKEAARASGARDSGARDSGARDSGGAQDERAGSRREKESGDDSRS